MVSEATTNIQDVRGSLKGEPVKEQCESSEIRGFIATWHKEQSENSEIRGVYSNMAQGTV